MSDDKALAKPADTRLKTVRDLLERSKGQLAMALPRHLTPERMMRVTLTAIQTTPALLECDPRSVIGAVVQAAQLGLEIGVMGQAYLVPYKRQAQLIVGYRGLLSLARRSGELASFEARIVHESDVFRFSYGTDGGIHHEPNLSAAGKVVCAYACAKLRSGEWAYEVMSVPQLEAIRAMSQMGHTGAWKAHTEEMYRKTVARRLLKWLPHSIEMATALEAEERAEVGLPAIGDLEIPEASPLAAITGQLQDKAAAEQQAGAEPSEEEQAEIRRREREEAGLPADDQDPERAAIQDEGKPAAKPSGKGPRAAFDEKK